MTTALATRLTRPIVVRPAPRREPPFDDEFPPSQRPAGRYDQVLPFAPPPRRVAWQPTSPRQRELPDPDPWARRLLIGMIEAAGGRRPLNQLAGLLSPSVCRGITADFERAARGGSPHWLHRASIASIRAVEPAEGVAELCATVETGRRVRALALRLEEHRGRWRCTRLQLG